jgi:eukaryotic-like serine/threonine-protein kinase
MTSSIPPSGSTSKLAFQGAVLVGKYRLEEVIGVGGMGSVWLATHMGLNQQIALKLVSSQFAKSSDALRRFDTEAKAAAKIKSRHVPQVYDNGVLEDGTPFLAMELLHGETLFSRVHRGGAVPLPEAVMIIEHCCRGLGRAHSLGIIHRDIKPENIFLAHSVDDDNYIVKVLDFGIAKIKNPLEAGEQSNTRTGSLLGTPMFMSPEQARGLRTIDHRTDLYSLGLVTYMMFTGNIAFNGETLGELLLQICTQPLPNLLAGAPWLPPTMEVWFQKACAREPDQRFPTAQAFIESMRIAGGLSAGLERPASNVPLAPGSSPGSLPASIPVSMPMGRPPGPMDLRPPPTMSDATRPRVAPLPNPTPSANSAVAFDGTVIAPASGGRGKIVAAVAAVAILAIVGVGVMLASRHHDAPAAAASPASAPAPVPTISAPVATLAPPASATPTDSASAAAPSAIPSASVAATVKPPVWQAPPRGGAVTPAPAAPKPPPPKPGNVDLGY